MDSIRIVLDLVLALVIGATIGLERTYRGRAAGFRTHALVCLTSAMLMMLAVYQGQWVPAAERDSLQIDPARVVQGIMTGIGFLGAGIIIHDGLSLRGLTTSASIWITAGIGILIGIHFYLPAMVAALLSLGTLSVFTWIERMVPRRYYANHVVRFARDMTMPEDQVRALVASQGVSITEIRYRSDGDKGEFEYGMVLQTMDRNNFRRLTDTWQSIKSVIEFRLSPRAE